LDTCHLLMNSQPSFSLSTTLTFFLSLHFPSLFTFPLRPSYALSTSLCPQTLATSLPSPQSLCFALPPQTRSTSLPPLTLSTSLHFPSLEPYPVLRTVHFSASSNPSHLSVATSDALSCSSFTNALHLSSFSNAFDIYAASNHLHDSLDSNPLHFCAAWNPLHSNRTLPLSTSSNPSHLSNAAWNALLKP